MANTARNNSARLEAEVIAPRLALDWAHPASALPVIPCEHPRLRCSFGPPVCPAHGLALQAQQFTARREQRAAIVPGQICATRIRRVGDEVVVAYTLRFFDKCVGLDLSPRWPEDGPARSARSKGSP